MLAITGTLCDNLVSIVENDVDSGITLANAGKYEQFPVEDVMSDDNLRHENQTLYPPQKRFIETYNLWLKHQSCFWSVHENDPSVDRDKFLSSAPKEFQEILLKTVGCIAVGDSIVLDRIASGLSEKITSIELKAMFTDQEAREFIHKKMYNNMLDIASNADYYRSEEFKNEYMGVLSQLTEKYSVDDIRIQMYFIMMCEIILFAPMFQTICYAATKGYCPKLCDLNLLVMRDEHIHYENARLQLSKFKTKLNCQFANDVLAEFREVTINLYRKIIGDYDDGVFNFKHVESHFNHVCDGFIYENGLKEMPDDFKFIDTPAKYYMNLPSCESKINRMEANSTIYTVPGDTTPLVKPKRNIDLERKTREQSVRRRLLSDFDYDFMVKRLCDDNLKPSNGNVSVLEFDDGGLKQMANMNDSDYEEDDAETIVDEEIRTKDDAM